MSTSRKILVIEDDEDIREYIRHILAKEGYEPIVTGDGETGIALAKKHLPDLIISDIMMEGIDGYEVLTHLSAGDATRMIPFIFLSGKVGHQNLRKGMELGADDYLFKPFRAPDLVSAVKARLNKYQSIKATVSAHSDADTDAAAPDGAQSNSPLRIFIPYNNTSIPLLTAEILYISAENQYSQIALADSRRLLVRKSLAQWEAMLPRTMFVRIHRSTLVNLRHVEKIEKCPPACYRVHLTNEPLPLEVSRRYVKHIRAVAATLLAEPRTGAPGAGRL